MIDVTLEQLKTTIQSTSGAAVICLVDGTVLCPLLHTRSLPAFFGMTEEEYQTRLSKDVASAVDGRDKTVLLGVLRETLDGGEREAACRFFHKDSGSFWGLLNFRLLGGVPR